MFTELNQTTGAAAIIPGNGAIPLRMGKALLQSQDAYRQMGKLIDGHRFATPRRRPGPW